MRTVYLSPHSARDLCVAVTYTRSTGAGFANTLNTNMKNVWFGVLDRGIYQGRDPGLGVDGWGRRG